MRARISLIVLSALISIACSAKAGTSPGDDSSNVPRLNRIVISGSIPTIHLGTVATVQLSAQGFDQKEAPFAAQITWSSSNAARASISSTGLLTIHALGTVTIRAESGTVTASVIVNIIPRPPASIVTAVTLDDITNTGTATDFEVSFERPSDESRVREYRAFLVKGAKAAAFTLTEANALAATQYRAVAGLSQSLRFTLAAGALDSDGDMIVEGTPYAALVLSVADGVNAVDNALSAPSDPIQSAQTTVKITFIGDDGVIVSDGTTTVAIDALPQASSVVVNGNAIAWIPPAAGVVNELQSGSSRWGPISLALVTHDHLDHWQIATTNGFLTGNPQARVIGPPQTMSNFASHPRAISLNPANFQSADTTVGGMRIRALRMLHFNNFGLDFSGVQNLAFLVEVGGKKILHLGDADYTTQNFAPFNLASENIDVVIVPGATVKLIAPNIELVRTLINPRHILAAHLETHMNEAGVRAVWGNDVRAFTQSLQFIRY